ncbi:uncharacterized protein LOC134281245 [Saccostrea cucullata]|uniref:uncharacterized protein LOC134281245 n=1 Tax=Saccostrea cuccullata TaxID=36930 RepID=UPI002ED1E3AA
MKLKAMLISILIVVGYICLHINACKWSDRTLDFVASCPATKDETNTAARNKRCEVVAWRQNCTKPSNFKYHCLYNYRQKGFVEVCSVESYIHGVCIVFDSRLSKIQPVYNAKCRDKSASCPAKYLSSEGHLYATCPELLNLTFFDIKGGDKNQNTPENKSQTGVYLAVIIPILIIIIISSISFFIYKRRRNRRSRQHDEERIPFLRKDPLSDLTEDEVFVLFCFLCSDSGPPDFTDTEWLDMLNEIRQRADDKNNPVKSEKAQQMLDRLKSREFLWEDQDKIKEDKKNHIMDRITSMKNYIPFPYISYVTASVYLRSHKYNKKPGEKCLSNSSWDSLLIRRLQINVLTHVTMEDTSIYDEIYQILNIPDNILNDSEDNREQFLLDLRRDGEAFHYLRKCKDSVHQVTWLWRYWINARPDIVRSCIGLHPHNDIYIIDNKAYRKPSSFHLFQSNVRCLLYTLLSVENYKLDVNKQSHRITRDKIRERYFPDITDDGLEDLPDGITETKKSVITFLSDDIRHDVMYAFVTECLVEDSDLEFFLTIASRDVISEYCRSWDYKRSDRERCLYLPVRPGELYNIFIDKLQLDIISHCTVTDREIHNKISEQLRVPDEVLQWDQEARERYVKYAKSGTERVHHARGMIVGCAGAGKTTLLKRLLGCTEEEIKEVKSTEGLEVHDEVFEICDETKSLKDAPCMAS